ncbi:acyloxyacyl hydrolase [Aquimarina agarilytica]|uniref:acyloxyacyl hydrolase n=1 Tax=Aquimarina agarilytica TaxID=1087449 RepID=UPI00028992A8|nr:acyloxyacyl hydrolase [Aquimarina agarilytica]
MKIGYLFLIIISANTYSQSKKEKSPHIGVAYKTLSQTKHKIGFNYGLGRNNGLGFTNINIETDYVVHLFQFQYYRSLIQKKWIGLEALGQPQINFGQIDHKKNTFEFGLNIGILIRFNLLKDKISIYGLISAGPHFISSTPSRQAPNFIFSDNFFGGINYRVSKNLFLDLRPGKRHLSNLDFQFPNGGINTFIINFGIMKLL